jgi:phosphatidylglycerol:prolipoprotein diacylglycerol transferase
MYPVLFRIGSFEVRSFGAVMAVAVALALWMAMRRATRWGLAPSVIPDLAFWTVLSGVIGSRVAFIAQEWAYYSQHPEHIWTFKFEGLTSFGGLVAGLLAMAIWARVRRIPMLAILDIASVPFLIAHAVGRFGCLLNGCCYGGPTNSILGVHFHGMTEARHPAQLYDSLMCLVAAWLISLTERRSIVTGRSFSLSLTAYGLSRFIYEFWRAGESSTYWGALPITQAQAAALFLIACGLIALWVVSRRVRHQPEVGTT